MRQQINLSFGHQVPKFLDQLSKKIKDIDDSFDEEDRQKSKVILEKILDQVKNIVPKNKKEK